MYDVWSLASRTQGKVSEDATDFQVVELTGRLLEAAHFLSFTNPHNEVGEHAPPAAGQIAH